MCTCRTIFKPKLPDHEPTKRLSASEVSPRMKRNYHGLQEKKALYIIVK